MHDIIDVIKSVMHKYDRVKDLDYTEPKPPLFFSKLVHTAAKELIENACKFSEKGTPINIHIFEDASGKSSLRQQLNEAYKDKLDLDNPKIFYLEVGLSNACNLKCVTCASNYSTSWYEDDLELKRIIEKKLIQIVEKHLPVQISKKDFIILINEMIKNESALHNSILVPGHPQLGMGLFEILAYERGENMKWSPLFNVDLVLPDSAAVDHRYMHFWSLSPGESFKQLFVIQVTPSAAWAFQVKYQPHVCTDYFKYAFRWYDDEG